MKGDHQGTMGDDEEFMELVFTVMGRIKDHFMQALDEVSLSPPQAHALFNLSQPQPVSQRELAKRLGYDASNITGIVDRLEERGLVERCVDPADRRVKHLVLTDDVRARVEKVWQQITAGNPFAEALTADEIVTIRPLLAKVAGDTVSPIPGWRDETRGSRRGAFI
jgi:DNA-binding MarR family transcriptional regulator